MVLGLLLRGWCPPPQGCSPWNLGHFLLVQKVTKDTPRGEGFRFISALRASLRSVALRNAPAGAAPFPWIPFPLNRQGRGLRAPSLIFPGDIVRKSFRIKRPEKGNPTLRPNAAKGRRAPRQTRKINQRRTGTSYRPLSVSGARGERRAKDAPIFDTICDEIRLY